MRKYRIEAMRKYKIGATTLRCRLGPSLSKNEVKQMFKMYDDGNVEIYKICDCFGISESTLYRYLREWKGRES